MDSYDLQVSTFYHSLTGRTIYTDLKESAKEAVPVNQVVRTGEFISEKLPLPLYVCPEILMRRRIAARLRFRFLMFTPGIIRDILLKRKCIRPKAAPEKGLCLFGPCQDLSGQGRAFYIVFPDFLLPLSGSSFYWSFGSLFCFILEES
jgi:hypothetical protein